MFQIKVFNCLDLNRGFLVLEVTPQPTEPQPLPKMTPV